MLLSNNIYYYTKMMLVTEFQGSGWHFFLFFLSLQQVQLLVGGSARQGACGPRSSGTSTGSKLALSSRRQHLL